MLTQARPPGWQPVSVPTGAQQSKDLIFLTLTGIILLLFPWLMVSPPLFMITLSALRHLPSPSDPSHTYTHAPSHSGPPIWLIWPQGTSNVNRVIGCCMVDPEKWGQMASPLHEFHRGVFYSHFLHLLLNFWTMFCCRRMYNLPGYVLLFFYYFPITIMFHCYLYSCWARRVYCVNKLLYVSISGLIMNYI